MNYKVELIGGSQDGQVTYLSELFKRIQLPTGLNSVLIYRLREDTPFIMDEETGAKTYYYEYESTK